MSEAVVESRPDRARALNTMAFVALGALVVPIAVVMAVEAHPLLAILFQRKSFTAADTARTAPLVAWYGISMPFLMSSYILQRGLQAIQARRTILVLSGALFATKLAGNLLAAPIFGIGGIAVSLAMMYGIHAILCAACLQRRTGPILDAGSGRELLKLAVAGAVCAGVLMGLDRVFPDGDSKSQELIRLLLRLGLAGVVYVAALAALRLRAIQALWTLRRSKRISLWAEGQE